MKITQGKVEALVRQCMMERIVDPAEVVASDLGIDAFDEAKAVDYLAEDALFEFTEPDLRASNWDKMGDCQFSLEPDVYTKWSEVERKAVLKATKLIEAFDVADLPSHRFS